MIIINNHINQLYSIKLKAFIIKTDKNIKGLITRYGGANSHMSIRCAELSITSAIGVGDKKFEEIILEKKIEVDPINQKINKI